MIAQETTPLLEVEEVTRTFGVGDTRVAAIRGVSLTIARGELVLIMGPSGSGKTTLLSMLGGLLRPTSGVIRLQGQTISALDERTLPRLRLRSIGFVFQDFNLLSALNVRDNVAIVAALAGMRRRAALERADTLLGELGLSERLRFLPEQLSGGEKQRVAIARALVNDPPLILADEPTANLDSRIGRDVVRHLHAIARDQRRGVVIVSHDQRIRDVAERVLWLEDGALSELAGMAVDPVCGMSVDRERALVLELADQRLYFCSRGCRDEYLAQPREETGDDIMQIVG